MIKRVAQNAVYDIADDVDLVEPGHELHSIFLLADWAIPMRA